MCVRGKIILQICQKSGANYKTCESNTIFYSHNMVVYTCKSQDVPYLVPVAATIAVFVPPLSSGHSVALRSAPLGSLFAVDSVIEWTPI